MCWLVKARPDMNAPIKKYFLVFEFAKYIAKLMKRVTKKLCRAKASALILYSHANGEKVCSYPTTMTEVPVVSGGVLGGVLVVSPFPGTGPPSSLLGTFLGPRIWDLSQVST